jgi:hypothetical protein
MTKDEFRKMNEELESKHISLAAIRLLYAWVFKAHFDGCFIEALTSVRNKLEHNEFVELCNKANEVVESSAGYSAYREELNRVLN